VNKDFQNFRQRRFDFRDVNTLWSCGTIGNDRLNSKIKANRDAHVWADMFTSVSRDQHYNTVTDITFTPKNAVIRMDGWISTTVGVGHLSFAAQGAEIQN